MHGVTFALQLTVGCEASRGLEEYGFTSIQPNSKISSCATSDRFQRHEESVANQDLDCMSLKAVRVKECKCKPGKYQAL
jgi:hypothetical protein